MWVTTWEGETSEGHSKGGCAVPAKLAAGDSEAGSPTTSVGRMLSPQHLRPPPAEPLLPQNQPSHRKMNIAHCEIFVMKRIPGWIFFFPNTLLLLKIPFIQSCLGQMSFCPGRKIKTKHLARSAGRASEGRGDGAFCRRSPAPHGSPRLPGARWVLNRHRPSSRSATGGPSFLGQRFRGAGFTHGASAPRKGKI